MAGITITQLQSELGAYIRSNNKQVQDWFYKSESPLLSRARTIRKVRGKWPAIHAILGNVLQEFASTWNEIGTTTFKVNELVAQHIKFNVPIIPSDMHDSWLSEMDEEDKSLENKSISQYIMNKVLKPRVMSDVRQLAIVGDIDSADAFLGAMDGIIQIIANGLANTDNPMYKVLLSATPTTSNIVDLVTEFEKKVPHNMRGMIKEVNMSSKWADEFSLKREDVQGAFTQFNDGFKKRTRINNWEIVAHSELGESNLIWAHLDGNLLKLVDTFDAPQITDVQKDDYKLKLFGEGHLGLGFGINQGVFVAQYTGSTSGTGSATNDATYFA